MNSLYGEFSLLLKSMETGFTQLLYRGEDELAFLTDWLNKKNETVETEKPAADTSIRGVIGKCAKCSDIKNKKFGFGTGENGIMIILNMPLNISTVERDKLKDASKELLKKMMAAINIELGKCYITNLIKCDTENSLNRPGLMLKNCEPILHREIQEINPRIVIVMGDDIAIKSLIKGNSGRSWHTIEHPITLIKNPKLKQSAWTILQKISNLI